MSHANVCSTFFTNKCTVRFSHVVYYLFLDVFHAPENDLVIDCKVRANPRPIISWLKDDQPIEFDERIQQIEHLDGNCELIINKPTVKDSGFYSCTATNSIGTSNTSHQVEYTPHPSYPGSRRESGGIVSSAISSSGFTSGAESDTDSKADPRERRPKLPRAKLPPSEKPVEEYVSRRQPPPTMEELLKARYFKSKLFLSLNFDVIRTFVFFLSFFLL